MSKFVIAWRDVNNLARALCIGHSIEEPVAVELVPAAQEEEEDRPYRAVRFESYDEAFAAAGPLCTSMLAGLDAAVIEEAEIEPQFAADRPSPRPMLETAPNPLLQEIASRDDEIAVMAKELQAERNVVASLLRQIDEMQAAHAAQNLLGDDTEGRHPPSDEAHAHPGEPAV